MPANKLSSNTCTNFQLAGYEVTLDQIDLKISEFESRVPHYYVGPNELLYPITFKINEKISIDGDIYKRDHYIGITLYKVCRFSMKYNFITYDGNNHICEQLKLMEYKNVFNCKSGLNSSLLTKSSVNQNLATSFATNIINFKDDFSDFSSIKGNITLKIVLAEEIQNYPNGIESSPWNYLISNEAIENLKKDENFVIKCQDERFYFNKTLLCIVSDVFRTMIQGKIGKESKTGIVEINDFNPDTIQAFKRICFENKDFEEGDSIPDLLLFAQKYFMNPLKQKCLNHLVNNLDANNIYDVVMIADQIQIDDENLLKICAKYMRLNRSKLDRNEEWLDFQKSHPSCMIKMMNFMLYSE